MIADVLTPFDLGSDPTWLCPTAYLIREAVHEHMQWVALLHHRPQTHIHLGLALAEVG